MHITIPRNPNKHIFQFDLSVPYDLHSANLPGDTSGAGSYLLNSNGDPRAQAAVSISSSYATVSSSLKNNFVSNLDFSFDSTGDNLYLIGNGYLTTSGTRHPSPADYPIQIHNVTNLFKQHDIKIFSTLIENGSKIKVIPAPKASSKPRSFFDKMNNWTKDENISEITYFKISKPNIIKGPIIKFLNEKLINELINITNIKPGDGLFLICEPEPKITISSGKIRTKLGETLELIDTNSFRFIWIIDFPMFEYNEELKKLEFYHNPFSMPKGGLKALETQDPANIKAFQYDIVCNGIEISSGAIRNHSPEIMYKTFEITGYSKEVVNDKFGAMIKAFQFGAPPHGGCAPGIDRMIMMLAKENNLREIVAFPMNQQSQDLLTNSPNNISKEQLKELCIELNIKPEINK